MDSSPPQPSAAERVWGINTLRLGIARHARTETLNALLRVSSEGFEAAVRVLYNDVEETQWRKIQETWTDPARHSLFTQAVRSIDCRPLSTEGERQFDYLPVAAYVQAFPRLCSLRVHRVWRLEWKRVARMRFEHVCGRYRRVCRRSEYHQGLADEDEVFPPVECAPAIPRSWIVKWKADLVLYCFPDDSLKVLNDVGPQGWGHLQLSVDQYIDVFGRLEPGAPDKVTIISDFFDSELSKILDAIRYLHARTRDLHIELRSVPTDMGGIDLHLREYISCRNEIRAYSRLRIPLGSLPETAADEWYGPWPPETPTELPRLTYLTGVVVYEGGTLDTAQNGIMWKDWLRVVALFLYRMGGPTCEYDVASVWRSRRGAERSWRFDAELRKAFRREMEIVRYEAAGGRVGWRQLVAAERV